ncbi:hypothetical protein [Nitrosomonas sp. Nm58]|uniref:hypothetical protein n=1 Tax=Nitrosomonas sp. Nm58 TaxID=200126 RepID=UPI0008999006|nr:hypothetical protein [Nitrosomonas sp. Nm58]SDY37779.1 hypothetical protein SAMN05421754_100818 [Nitrosomonas sp. Nm58]
MKTMRMKHYKQPVKCKVQVTMKDGRSFTYNGLFKSTSEAVMDALEKYGIVKVDARAA